ncbi:MAG: tetratricopeptide repeat protein [Syntrophomonas sp.]
MKFCAKCGKELQDDARFCGGCGSGGDVISANANKATFGTSPLSVDALLTPVPTPKSAARTKIILGSILAILIVVGGFWGWNTLGTEARVQAKLDLAVKYLSENDYDKAILTFNDAINIDSKEVKAYQGLARVYTIKGDYDNAKSTYDKGLTSVAAEKKQTLQIGLAGMYIDQGQLDKAEQAFQEINNSNASCLEAYFGLATVYQQKGDNAKAEAILCQAVANNPNEYRAYNTLALYLKQNNKTDDSFNNLVKSLSLEINQQEAYLILTDLYKGNWNALQSKASLITDEHAAMLQFYGYYASEDYQKAITIFREKLNQQNGSQKARILAAIAILKQGDKPGAEALIKQLTKEKLNDWLLSDLGRYYLEAGDKEKAKEYALKALKANTTNLDAIVILQTVNSADSSAKVYTTQDLLYNWKPLVKANEDLQLRSVVSPIRLPAISNSASNQVNGANKVEQTGDQDNTGKKTGEKDKSNTAPTEDSKDSNKANTITPQQAAELVANQNKGCYCLAYDYDQNKYLVSVFENKSQDGHYYRGRPSPYFVDKKTGQVSLLEKYPTDFDMNKLDHYLAVYITKWND